MIPLITIYICAQIILIKKEKPACSSWRYMLSKIRHHFNVLVVSVVLNLSGEIIVNHLKIED